MFLNHPQIYKCLWIVDALGVNWGWVVFLTACKIKLSFFNVGYQRLFNNK